MPHLLLGKVFTRLPPPEKKVLFYSSVRGAAADTTHPHSPPAPPDPRSTTAASTVEIRKGNSHTAAIPFPGLQPEPGIPDCWALTSPPRPNTIPGPSSINPNRGLPHLRLPPHPPQLNPSQTHFGSIQRHISHLQRVLPQIYSFQSS